MLKCNIFSVGKTKEKWLEMAINEYKKRLQATLSLEFIWAKDDEQLERLVEKEQHVICLDVFGEMMGSEQFSKYMMDQFEKGGSKVSIVIGGADGLPSNMKKKYPLISLSLMTLTHQCTRLILVEQIYRAFEIARGSKYHK
jgi:23S rRNA (pseudouridine1915-N3)-methyltransferase